MLENVNLEHVLFLDIETVPQASGFDQLNDSAKTLWEHKAQHLKKADNETAADIYSRAGIYAEFGKIICISVGYFSKTGNSRQFRIKSFYGHHEAEILRQFSNLLNSHFSRKESLLCAHNGKEFDFPYLSRRMLINGIKLPALLDTSSKKPWEVQHLDTMELWRFGDYKSFTPINLLAHIFNIPSPKDDIDGSQVWHVYWNENNLDRIVAYCQKDVLTVAQLLLCYLIQPILKTEEVVIT